MDQSKRDFEVIILAGGMGTRLREVSGDIPKPMVAVAGMPFIYRIMQRLEAGGATRLVLALGYNAEYFIKRIDKDTPVTIPIEFVVEDYILGTGGAIKNASKFIHSDYFIVLNGDTFCQICYQEFLAHALNTGLDICISGVFVNNAERYGTLSIDGNGFVRGMNEKGISGPGIINSGIYFIRKKVFSDVKRETFSFEHDILAASQHRLCAYVSDTYFVDIGIPEDYYRACEYFRNNCFAPS